MSLFPREISVNLYCQIRSKRSNRFRKCRSASREIASTAPQQFQALFACFIYWSETQPRSPAKFNNTRFSANSSLLSFSLHQTRCALRISWGSMCCHISTRRARLPGHPELKTLQGEAAASRPWEAVSRCTDLCVFRILPCVVIMEFLAILSGSLT